MKPWQLIDSAAVPGQKGTLELFQRDREFSLRVDGCELMNSRQHGSEDALAEMACEALAGRKGVRLLIGGLGMGYTAAAALRHLAPDDRVVVAELVPAVIDWNRGPLGHLAGHPLQDERVTVQEGDVARLLRESREAYDAILLDVDNGPQGLTRKGNIWLYQREGLQAARRALRPGGVLLVWSAGPDAAFSQRLKGVGFAVNERRVRARGGAGGSRHTIWVAAK